MSRFSKSEAEARGWAFVHVQEDSEVVTSETQGEKRLVEGYVRAEKTYNGLMINEVAPTQGRLLEQIAAREAHWDAVNASSEISERIGEPENAGEPGGAVRDVILPSGEAITTAEFAARSRRDTLVVASDDDDAVHGRKQVILGGSEEALDADAEIEARQAEIELMRTEEADVGPTEQISVEAPQLDNPGGHGGGLLVVREGESVADAAERKAALKEEKENARVVASDTPLGTPAPEDKPELAGVDGGIQERGDLESEQADQGATVEAAEAAEHVVEVEDESVEAGQEASAKAAEASPTPAAAELAEQEGLDISEVEGSGAEGRVTKADVEAALKDAASDKE